MITTTTLFAALVNFFVIHKADIASKMVASAGYDMMKRALDFTGLSAKIGRFFKKKSNTDKFIEQVCNTELNVDQDPEPVLRSTYENLTGDAFPPSLFEEMKTWIEENQKQLVQNVSNVTFTNSSGFNIGGQQAQGNIINVAGNYNVGNDKKED